MRVTIGELTELDRAALMAELKKASGDGIEPEWVERKQSDRGNEDLGIFTVAVPLTIAVAGVLKVWIKNRAPLTEVTVQAGDRAITVKQSGSQMTPDDLAAFIAALGPPADK